MTFTTQEIIAFFLRVQLQAAQHLGGQRMNLSRLKGLALAIGGLIRARKVQIHEIAAQMDTPAQNRSNEKRVFRLLHEVEFDFTQVALMLLALLPQHEAFELVLDRTNWKFGARHYNVLMVALHFQGTALPLYWAVWEQQGNSDSAARQAIIEKCLLVLPRERLAGVYGDREFIGEKWVKWLMAEGIPFWLRHRENIYASYQGERRTFREWLGEADELVLEGIEIYGEKLAVGLKRLGDDELLSVVTNRSGATAGAEYRKRWSIETMFQSFKGRGFDLEKTCLKSGEALGKLLILVSLAYSLCVRLGWQKNEEREIPVKNHGYKAHSYFRMGLDYLREQWKFGRSVWRELQVILWNFSKFLRLCKIVQ